MNVSGDLSFFFLSVHTLYDLYRHNKSGRNNLADTVGFPAKTENKHRGEEQTPRLNTF